MKILVACEFSQVVTKAFRTRGHEAYSCDLLPAEGGHPEWHFQGDMFDLDLTSYDLIIAHPPCTAVCVSGNRYYSGTQARIDGAEFVRRIWNIPVEKLCIENPVGVLNRLVPELPKPQYIQPWQFGHPESKKTGLWLRGLPKLVPTNVLEKTGRWENQTPSGQNKLAPSKDRWKERSKTYKGIAEAMAEQWGG